jgi:hypothetical protein
MKKYGFSLLFLAVSVYLKYPYQVGDVIFESPIPFSQLSSLQQIKFLRKNRQILPFSEFLGAIQKICDTFLGGFRTSPPPSTH